MSSCELKLVVLGAGGVGKSALTIQFVQGNFVDHYEATIEDAYRKSAEIDGQLHQLDILDTAGQEQYRTIKDVYYRRGDGFIIVYSLCDEESWKEAQTIQAELMAARPDFQDLHQDDCKVPVIIAGNKLDLVQATPSERRVQPDEVLAKVKNWNCRAYETSAKGRIAVEETFHECIRGVKKMQAAVASRGGRSGSAKPAGDAPAPAPAPAAAPPPPAADGEEKPKKKKKKRCAIL